jgi:predicted TIM-barrel fold metal-dependent hydrolase
MRLLSLLRSPASVGLLTSAVSLAVWAALGVGANFGVPAPLTVVGLVWLVTIGLPTSVGVVVAATVWGHSEALSGLPGFLVLASALGAGLQIGASVVGQRLLSKARAKGRPWRLRRGLSVAGVAAALVLAALWLTHRPVAAPSVVIDGHVHLFGDEGWPPVHKQSSGLSPAQRENPTYGLLNRLLRLPPAGDRNERFLQAFVGQVQDARARLGSYQGVLLAQDCRYDSAGQPDWANTTFYVPNERLFQAVARYPDLFIPCPSINPQRKDWAAELDYCLAQGARVLKIHPPTQAVNPDDPRFRDFYRKCAQSGMRIMVHTGAEHSAPIASASLGDPRLLELALAEGCTVIAAHAGTKAFFDPPAEDHFPDLVAMMARHPRLYADTAVLTSQFRWRCIPQIVRTPEALPRMIFASDWPFPSNAMVFWHRLHPFATVELMAEPNLLVRAGRLKQALGLPPAAFSEIGRLLPARVTSTRSGASS